ncbi:Auxin-responsive protein [Vigna angularis]|uniref:Auxin-responsive protein n=1 Tax=Phaseolus angularis TaxID=3914 RepID=A0A8T0KIZ7_PHAAN|nr:auxin-responsive protein SAUR32 [Vigna angularis]KAG2399624.1 Auxin-responsive protein [Vigna angularis]
MGILSDHHHNSPKHHHHHHYHMSFHLHIPHLHFPHHHQEKKDLKDVPKGCLAVLVGQGEEQQRFVIPVMYMNHPLFMKLLKEAEDEYGFQQKGPITIPCHVEHFRTVQGIIDREKCLHHHHHHHHHAWCFKV